MPEQFSTATKIRQVDDYCLVAKRWLELDWTRVENQLVKKTFMLEKELCTTIALAKKKKISKIEVLLNGESSLLETILKKQGFGAALTELELHLDAYVPAETADMELSLSSQCPSQKALHKILLEQVNYHHQHLPEYYLSAGKVNWSNYLRQVKEDADKKNGLLLIAKEEEMINALILGETNQKQANIWELIVADGRRQNHLGTFLLNEYIQRLKILRVERLVLETLTDSYAKTWYVKLGFQSIGQSYFLSLE